ncbi:MAG TPA: YbaN family protein [Bdellovibrionota bacterium]|jgi:uncharacterized membrane protein YbaN (DUF454 family)|nr:YbaN family protein [Bdellovibrionota bacterium]
MTKEKAFLALGWLFLVLAMVGIALPIVPQVPFAVIAAYFFSKGSPRLHRWIRENKYLGKPVREWEDHHAVAHKTKIVSCVMMVGGAAIGHTQLTLGWALALDAAFLACIAFVLTRKTAVATA